MANRLEGFDGNAVEVFSIAEAYAKEYMNVSIEPAHILKALCCIKILAWCLSSRKH